MNPSALSLRALASNEPANSPGTPLWKKPGRSITTASYRESVYHKQKMRFFLALTLVVFPAAGADLLVAAASDLATFAQPLASGFKKETGQTVRFTFSASGSLAQQIENGAPYDVFLSANEQF